jgi:hypothetical protein
MITKLEDGMQISVLPFPNTGKCFIKEYRLSINNKLIALPDAVFFKNIYVDIFRQTHNKNIKPPGFSQKYYFIGLLNDKLQLFVCGRKIFEIVNNCDDKFLIENNNHIKNKKLYVDIKPINMNGYVVLQNYDNSFIDHKYFDTKYDNIGEYKVDADKFIEFLALKTNATINNNMNLIHDYYVENDLELSPELCLYLRKLKIKKIETNIL